jgi:hypothetical protein
MPEDKLAIPEHYKLLAQELKPLVNVIQDALIHRPLASVCRNADADEIFRCCLDSLNVSTGELRHALDEINSRILSGKNTGHNEIINSVSSLYKTVRKLIHILHDIRKESFPNDLAQGQTLLSAIPERVLQECLSAFEKIIDIIEKPKEMITCNGGNSFSIRVNLGAEETNQFSGWLRNRAGYKDSGLSQVTAVFLLYLWLGRDNDK